LAVIAAGLNFLVTGSLTAALQPGPYQTVPGSMVLEIDDRLTNGTIYMGNPNVLQRLMPLTATLTFNFAGPTPILISVIHDALFEGGPPFETTVFGAGAGSPTRFTGNY